MNSAIDKWRTRKALVRKHFDKITVLKREPELQLEIVINADKNNIVYSPPMKKAKLLRSLIRAVMTLRAKPRSYYNLLLVHHLVRYERVTLIFVMPPEIAPMFLRNFHRSLRGRVGRQREESNRLTVQRLYDAHVPATYCALMLLAYKHMN